MVPARAPAARRYPLRGLLSYAGCNPPLPLASAAGTALPPVAVRDVACVRVDATTVERMAYDALVRQALVPAVGAKQRYGLPIPPRYWWELRRVALPSRDRHVVRGRSRKKGRPLAVRWDSPGAWADLVEHRRMRVKVPFCAQLSLVWRRLGCSS